MKHMLLALSLILARGAMADECRLNHPVPLPNPFATESPALFHGVTLNKIPKSVWRSGEIVNGQGQLKVFDVRIAGTSDLGQRTGFLAASYARDFSAGPVDLGYGFSELYMQMGGARLSGRAETVDGVTTYSTVDDWGWTRNTVHLKVKDGELLSVEFVMPILDEKVNFIRPIEYESICVLDMH